MGQVYGRGDLPSTEIEILCDPALAGFDCYVTAPTLRVDKELRITTLLIDLLTIHFIIYCICSDSDHCLLPGRGLRENY